MTKQYRTTEELATYVANLCARDAVRGTMNAVKARVLVRLQNAAAIEMSLATLRAAEAHVTYLGSK